MTGPARLLDSIAPEELYAKARFTECLGETKGDPAKRVLRARALIRLRRFRDARAELERVGEGKGDTAATVLALQLHCGVALGDRAAVTTLLDRARVLGRLSDAGRAEIAIARAYEAFYRGDAVTMRNILLTISEAAGPRFYAWRLFLLGMAASLQQQYEDQARYLEQMVRFIDETPAAAEVVLLASAAQTLADLSREVPSLTVFEFAENLARHVPWTPDLAEAKFLTERSLAWAHAAHGSHRTAQRMMHACADNAPSPRWRATIYGELAYMIRLVGAGEAADAMFEHATDFARAISWETAREERVGLLSLVELIADHDPATSDALLKMYDGIGTELSRHLVMAHDRRLVAIEQHARGCTLAAAGDAVGALALFERSLLTFQKLGLAWRAAGSALRLHALTGDRKWIRRAADAVAHFPRSAMAAEVRRREIGFADPRLAALTSTQRRAFRLVCEGLTDAQIATALKITTNTARNHVAAIRQCFGAHSRSQVVAIARSSGLFV